MTFNAIEYFNKLNIYFIFLMNFLKFIKIIKLIIKNYNKNKFLLINNKNFL
jgi:hypothetical protein